MNLRLKKIMEGLKNDADAFSQYQSSALTVDFAVGISGGKNHNTVCTESDCVNYDCVNSSCGGSRNRNCSNNSCLGATEEDSRIDSGTSSTG